MTRSPLVWFGGKSKVAHQIIRRMPEHRVYVEPFGGAAHVIAQKPPIPREIYNDIDGNLVNFIMVVKDQPSQLEAACLKLPYSRELFERWRPAEQPKDPFERAVRFFYLNRCGMAVGNNPDNKSLSWRNSTTSNQSPTDGYRSACKQLSNFAERMSAVMIENDDFRKVIKRYDSPSTLFYVDPPYIGREKYYAGGFTEQDHRELAGILNSVEGKAIISYYDDPLLDEIYKDPWRRETFQATRQFSSDENYYAEELLLMNFNDGQLTLF